MTALVSLEEANIALRLDLMGGDRREPDIAAKIEQAQSAVLDFLKVDPEEYEPDEAALPRIKAAILLIVGSLVDDSKAEMLSGLGTGDPKNPVVALLYRLRDPALA